MGLPRSIQCAVVAENFSLNARSVGSSTPWSTGEGVTAIRFTTGNSPGGWLLESVALRGTSERTEHLMIEIRDDAEGSPSGTASAMSGSVLNVLSRHQQEGRVVSFESFDSAALVENTDYWLVFYTQSDVPQRTYSQFFVTDSPSENAIEGWSIADDSSNYWGSQGVEWQAFGDSIIGPRIPYLSISAVSVPEPSVVGMLGCSVLFFRRRRS